MPQLTDMMNLGTEMARKLRSVGIDTPAQLAAAGSKQAFLQLKQRYPKVCLVHLYCLEGAITNTAYNSLPEATKRELKEFSDFLRQ